MRLLSVAFAFAVAGCYQIDADITGLSASAGQESFVAGGAMTGQTMAIDRTLVFDNNSSLAKTLRAARIDTMTLTPAHGVAALDFLTSVTLVLHGADRDIPLVDASGKMTAPDGSVQLPIGVAIDPALLSQPIRVDATLRLIAPAEAWSVDIAAALTVQGHLDVKL